MLSFEKLENVLKEKNLNKFYLRNNGINPTQLNKMIKNGDCGGKTIDKLCKLLNCQPGDIMEYIEEEAIEHDNTSLSTPEDNTIKTDIEKSSEQPKEPTQPKKRTYEDMDNFLKQRERDGLA